jgi:PPOX class probable F420-dependent enzyme
MTALTPELRALLEGPNYATLATVLPDGAPHAVPLWITVLDGRIAVMTGPGSRKARNIERDPRVAISITDRDQPFAMAAIRGRVVERIEGEAAWEIVDRISTVYIGAPYSREQERVIFLIEPDHITTTLTP